MPAAAEGGAARAAQLHQHRRPLHLPLPPPPPVLLLPLLLPLCLLPLLPLPLRRLVSSVFVQYCVCVTSSVH